MEIKNAFVSSKSVRLSNIELFRVVAMFLVLVVHANYFTFGMPTTERFQSTPLFVAGQYFFQALSIGCVNMFVLISGWFGIKPKRKGFSNLIFQCAFFLFTIWIYSLLIGIADLSVKGLIKNFLGCLLLYNSGWFVLSYIGLYLISPVLNAFVETASKKQFKTVLISFFLFQTIYSWLTSTAVFFVCGYSTISFIGLYLLARYCRLYPSKFVTLSKKYDLLIYIFCIVLISLTSLVCMALANRYSKSFIVITDMLYYYVNPLVIIMSLYLLLFFSKLTISNKFINWLGASSFAVYLFHMNPNLCMPYFRDPILFIGNNYNGIVFLLVVLVYLVLIFLLSVLIDQIRLFLWNKIIYRII